MRVKKIVALATVLAMVLASTGIASVAATTTSTGSTSGSVTGDSTYVDTVRYKVTLPTSASLDFNVDPEGLFGYFLANPSATAVDQTDLTGFAGQVVSTNYATVKNQSSVPIIVTCDFNVTTTADVTLVDFNGGSGTVDDEANELALAVLPCVSGSAIAAVTGSATSVISTDPAAPNSMDFGLLPADYEFTTDGSAYDYVQKAPGSGVTTETEAYFRIGGIVSKLADWSAIAQSGNEVNLSCVFSYEGVKDITGAIASDGTSLVSTPASITYFATPTPTATPSPTATPTPTTAPTPVPTAISLQTIAVAGGAGVNITSAYTVDKGIYLYTGSMFKTDLVSTLGTIKVNGVTNVPGSSGNSSGNGGALWFKLATGTTLHVGDVITIVVGSVTYTYTVTQ